MPRKYCTPASVFVSGALKALFITIPGRDRSSYPHPDRTSGQRAPGKSWNHRKIRRVNR